MSRKFAKKKGFTLVELLVSISIFVIMTALLIAKYGNFNNSVLLTNMAYDISLAIRTAQTYGLSVQGKELNFQYPYGIAFCSSSSSCTGPSSGVTHTTFTNKEMIFFADAGSGAKGSFGDGDIEIAAYSIKRGAKVLNFCVSEGTTCDPSSSYKRLDISFLRPNPDAIICAGKSAGAVAGNPCAKTFSGALGQKAYVKIVIQAVDGSTKSIVIRKTGQISVEN